MNVKAMILPLKGDWLRLYVYFFFPFFVAVQSELFCGVDAGFMSLKNLLKLIFLCLGYYLVVL